MLYELKPQADEGYLSKMRSVSVCEKSFAEVARKLHLGDYLLLGKGEAQNGGNDKDSTLADCFESVIAAVYFDGGFEQARKCILKKVNKKETKKFLTANHLQSYCKGQSICLGLYFNNELVQIMTFGNPRYNKKYQYELLRLCTKNDCYVIGGIKKLFKYFIIEYNPDSIISYCDASKFTGKVYSEIGFTKEKISVPSCHWYNLKTKQHINNTLLLKLGFDKIFGTNFGKGSDNEELMLKNNFVQVYDCGQDSYIWKRE
jgi:hypothetical protein